MFLAANPDFTAQIGRQPTYPGRRKKQHFIEGYLQAGLPLGGSGQTAGQQ
ncbi:hypothetical protein [Sinorhizobium sp. CCBAU 05631]|nr:hypothetical protein [Sinorhizobium sp. CCBAU 05631]ASY57943.1 hypothetical protein SS05631_c30200 [Sinorhizobium sp. CCBAU 05631]